MCVCVGAAWLVSAAACRHWVVRHGMGYMGGRCERMGRAWAPWRMAAKPLCGWLRVAGRRALRAPHPA